jgi:7-cyano-7-deazaguanine synthase
VSKKAVILISGGIDSTTTLALAKTEGFDLYTLSIQYGQRNDYELQFAQKIAQSMGVKKHLVLDIDLSRIGGSALTTDIPVPKHQNEMKTNQTIPITYVPARNTIFLSLGLAWAESLGASDIFIGVNAVDYSGYPDCRPQFIQAFEKMANLGTRTGTEGKSFRIHTPLIQMTKAQIIRRGTALGIDYSQTHSCYDPSPEGKACGMCNSCILRKKGFKEAGIPDPTVYNCF